MAERRADAGPTGDLGNGERTVPRQRRLRGQTGRLGMSGERAPVRLGHQAEGSIAPALFALVERGAARSPAAAQQLRGRVELRFDEGYPPVSVAPGPDACLVVEDVHTGSPQPELVVIGPLPKLLELATVPRAAGLPSFRDPRGRAALATLARGGVRLQGSKLLGRRLLALLEL